ncbi:hypothetical protein [Methylobacterium nodulans]|uniref:Helix-turn-helix domain-containing protein n=1 Tax=Methylobacterium nodulans (strain LMG 21967 / CNCM I-2342 / ORS 2060) TaxID=460265 RepID=B8IXK0_METNO|nr:hypothetical protein [Methylobacterium nodulans]ACL62832.1 hypothetical protein Mnod_7798 [Methylobacterium nodulans ORS 2060]
MPRISALLCLACHGKPEEQWTQIAYAGLLAEPPQWSESDVAAFEALTPRQRSDLVVGHMTDIPTVRVEPAQERRKRRQRDNRLRQRRHLAGFRYVRRHALDPFLDARLSAGARTTLIYLIARCGRGQAFTKRTCLVATDLGIAQRTVQAHYAALEGAGYIARSAPDPQTGATTIVLTHLVEPPMPRKKQAGTDTRSQEGRAQEFAPTQAIKDSKTRENEVSDASSVSVARGSQKTGAALVEAAQPPSSVLGDNPLVGSVGQTREMLRPDIAREVQSARAVRPADTEELTPFDRAMNEILLRVAAHRSKTSEGIVTRSDGTPAQAAVGQGACSPSRTPATNSHPRSSNTPSGQACHVERNFLSLLAPRTIVVRVFPTT